MISLSSIHHFAISVADVEATIDWYARHFGFEIEFDVDFDDVDTRIVLLRRDALRIELLYNPRTVPSPDKGKDMFAAIDTLGPKHIGLRVDDIEEVVRIIEASNIEVLRGLEDVPQTNSRNLFILDNEGNQLEITASM